MKVNWFHLMSYRWLPEDFRRRHRGVGGDIPIMGGIRRIVIFAFALAFVLLAAAPQARAAATDAPDQNVLNAQKSESGAATSIPPGTVITMQNWRTYKAFMPYGMIKLFEGGMVYKMPSDVEIHVGATKINPLPKPFWDAVEKYSSQVRLVKLPNGAYNIINFVAAVPFPHPSGPEKGTEVADDVTFRPGGMLYTGFPDLKENQESYFCTQDRFLNKACTRVDYDYRQLAYNWFPNTPRVDPNAAGAWYGEWLMVVKPEESKYTAQLTLYYQDVTKDPGTFVFIPALRRSLRLSTSARCAPLFGSDMTNDDARVGWNGGASVFVGKSLPDQSIIALTDLTHADGVYPGNYVMPLGWAKPSWGDWMVMPVWVTDVRRVPSMAAGYCYGSRMMYTTKAYFANVHEDLYDSNYKLWKVVQISLNPEVDGLHPEWGKQFFGGILEQYWDVQNQHASHVFTANPEGADLIPDIGWHTPYDNVKLYQSPGGLMQIMR
jgi:Protein of unknown function (DUF1329)